MIDDPGAVDDLVFWHWRTPLASTNGSSLWGRVASGYPVSVIVAGVDVDEARLAAVCERYGIGRLMSSGPSLVARRVR